MMALVLSSLLVAQAVHMPPLQGSFEGPQCAEDDNSCLLRSLDYQVRMSEMRRLQLEHADAALKAATAWGNAESSEKMKFKEEAERQPSRMRWFLLGATGALAVTLGIVLATH